MKRMILWMLTLITVGMCHAEDVAIHYNGASAKVKNKVKDSVTITINGADINIESLYTKHQLTLRLSGMSDNGRLMLKSVGKAKITLDGLTLTSQEGAPLWLKNKKKVEIETAKGTENTLVVTACTDTVNNKGAVIWSKDKLLLSGKGVLNVVATGDGCRAAVAFRLLATTAQCRVVSAANISMLHPRRASPQRARLPSTAAA